MTDDKKVALLPCPFCGKIPSEVVQWGWHGEGWVMDKEGWAVRGCAHHTHGNSRDEAIAAWNTRQPQTDARVADLLFKLDVAATTFEKVTTSEHREAVFNAEHAKLLRDTIKVLRQPQTDALKIARAALEVLSQRLEGIGGCTDGHCLVTGPRKGMHTNGGCSCLRHDKYKAERVVSQYHIFHREIIAALKESK
jgi:hypothetical protein